MAIADITLEIIEAYSAFVSTLPLFFQNFINLLLLVVLIVIYVVFIWKFRGFIGSKNIFNFDLNKYNKAEHPLLDKILASGLYLLEYVIILPFIIFFWFSIFTFFLVLLVEGSVSIGTILLISAISIAVIRMASYIPNYGERLSEDLAKLLPLTILAVTALNPSVFTRDFLERAVLRANELPTFLPAMLNYLIFIIVLEVILRFFDFFFRIIGLEDDVEEHSKKVREE